jgi:hypothetical protein
MRVLAAKHLPFRKSSPDRSLTRNPGQALPARSDTLLIVGFRVQRHTLLEESRGSCHITGRQRRRAELT